MLLRLFQSEATQETGPPVAIAKIAPVLLITSSGDRASLEQVKPTDEPAHIIEAFMSRTILIVDDDPVQLRMLEAALMKLGYPTVAADSGEAALKRLDAFAEGEPAAILLDLVMPGMGGLEVLETLRQRDIAVPVIVQTAQGSIEVAVSAMRAGAFDFVVKPASMERLRTALDSALKVGSVETAARRRNRAWAERGMSTLDSRPRAPGLLQARLA
jgi:DNA-binding NtrC family response regulator